MRVRAAEIFLIRLKLRERFETSFGAVQDREILLLRLDSDAGESWSEVVADREPYYGPETVDTARHILRDYLLPMLRDREIADARSAHDLLAHVRGNPMARAAVEMNLWNIEALGSGVPLGVLLGGTRSRVASGVSVGLQASTEQLVDKVGAYVERGYQRIKIKIKPGEDVELVKAVRRAFPGIPLMADANAAYRLADTTILRDLDGYGLMMIEQPLSHEDLVEHAELAVSLRTPICLDESISGIHACRAALRLGSCSIVNIKPGRVSGFTESIAIHDACAAAAVPVWCGGMLESGIGRAYNVHLASLPNFTLPGDISESARYWHEDIVEPPFELRSGGWIDVPSGAGLGVTVRRDRIERCKVASERVF